MNTVREYRMPLMIGAGALVVALLLYAILVSPQSSKLTSLQAQETQLQTQQTALQAKLAALKAEKQNLTKSCADLEKIATQIPSVESPTDVDAEESSFESQFNGLAETSGVTLTQFSGFAPASTTSATPATTTARNLPAGVVAVPTTLAVTGNYSQITAFINGLDKFPRLFVIQTFNLTFGHERHQYERRIELASQRLRQRPRRKQPALWVAERPPRPPPGPTIWPSSDRSTTPRHPTPWPRAPRPPRPSTRSLVRT